MKKKCISVDCNVQIRGYTYKHKGGREIFIKYMCEYKHRGIVTTSTSFLKVVHKRRYLSNQVFIILLYGKSRTTKCLTKTSLL